MKIIRELAQNMETLKILTIITEYIICICKHSAWSVLYPSNSITKYIWFFSERDCWHWV